jgi:hypothetical protein
MKDVGIFCVHFVNFRPFDILYGHLVYFFLFWDIFTGFGMLYQEKSGNHALQLQQNLKVRISG